MLPPCIALSHPYQILTSPRNGHLKSPQWHILNTCWKPCMYTHIYTNKKYLYLRFEDISLKLTPPSPNLLALRGNCLNNPTLSFSMLGPAELLVVTCFRGDLLRGVLLFSLWWDISKFGLLILMASLLWLEAEYFFLSTGLRTCVSFSGGSWDSTVKLKT